MATKTTTKAPSAKQVAARKKLALASKWAKTNKRVGETHAQAVKRYFATR